MRRAQGTERLESFASVVYDTGGQGGALAQIEVHEYITAQGRNLYRAWLEVLDPSVKKRVQARVRRMGMGNFGKGRHLGGGMHEAIFDFGPGYRLYYGYHLGLLILLLSGGDKSDQNKDIKKAMGYWQDYQNGGSQ